MKKIFYFLCFLLINFSVCAEPKKSFDLWKKDIEKQLVNKGIYKSTLDKYFKNVSFLQSVIDADRKQSEFSLAFSDYMQKMVTESRIKRAKELFKEHRRLLMHIENKYEIPANYLLAFWALETNFGQNKGNLPTLSTLATLSYDERRSDFFFEQLLTMLRILQKENIKEPKGSWAGAFGHFQFMPTTFSQYAVDEDLDKKIDIYENFYDAIGSAANYLSKMGWKKGIRWGREVLILTPTVFNHLDEKHPISFWSEAGVVKLDHSVFNEDEYDIEAELILPQGKDGSVFLVYKNFNVIKRWNNSDFYALAVGVLADKIAGYSTTDVSTIRKDMPISRSDVKTLQEMLTAIGIYEGAVDGVLGKKTKQALKQYQRQHQLIEDGFLSKELFDKIVEDYKKKKEA